MAHLSVVPNRIRVDIWRAPGKWHETIGVIWNYYRSSDGKEFTFEFLDDTLLRCLKEQFPGSFRGMLATCLEPCAAYAYPIMVKIPDE